MTRSVFCIITAMVMAEITCVYPSAGAVYNWSRELAPDHIGPAASYLTGWFNLLGNVGAGTAFANGFALCVKDSLGTWDSSWARSAAAPHTVPGISL